MTDTSTRSLHEQALAAQDFLATLGTTMIRLELPPVVVIGLFGKFTERLVQHQVEASGREEADVMISAFNAFATGLGMQTKMTRVEGKDAEQLHAEVERANRSGPLQ